MKKCEDCMRFDKKCYMKLINPNQDCPMWAGQCINCINIKGCVHSADYWQEPIIGCRFFKPITIDHSISLN